MPFESWIPAPCHQSDHPGGHSAQAQPRAAIGLLFLHEINRHNPTPPLRVIEATNPCGGPYWKRSGAPIRGAVVFDDVIEASCNPLFES
jgi:hypothetical protein